MSDDLYNQIIRPNYTKLSEDAIPDHIVDLLYQYGGINFHDMEKISKITQNTGYRDGMKALLNILRQKGPDVVRMFVSVLGETGYVDLQKQLQIFENRQLPEPTSVLLENHSNRILQLEQKEAENKDEIEHLKSENREMKIQLLALKAELNAKNETKNQNEYRSQNQEIRGQIPFILPNPTKIELSQWTAEQKERLMFEEWLKFGFGDQRR